MFIDKNIICTFYFQIKVTLRLVCCLKLLIVLFAWYLLLITFLILTCKQGYCVTRRETRYRFVRLKL
jgi:hypothetical protein